MRKLIAAGALAALVLTGADVLYDAASAHHGRGRHRIIARCEVNRFGGVWCTGFVGGAPVGKPRP